MSYNRSLGRDVHIYDASGLRVLGGLILNNGVTNANFHSMVEIIIIFDNGYLLYDEGGNLVGRDDHPLQPGKYYVITGGGLFQHSNDPWLVRTVSVSSRRVAAFCDAVYERDRRCVITGEEATSARSFKAAHIFPLAYEEHWMDRRYDRWITIPSAKGSINSVQNGLLLESSIRELFEGYHVSINPDDNYKIVCFDKDRKGIAGKHLDKRFLEDPRRPVDQLLRWHFRQAVLANVRRDGEPIFEVNFRPRSDMISRIRLGPKAGERMEYELFSRLAESLEAQEPCEAEESREAKDKVFVITNVYYY